MSTNDALWMGLGALILIWIVWGAVQRIRRSGEPYSVPLAYLVDFSWSRPSAEDLRAAGYSGVIRYLSWDTTGKNLTADEANYWKAHGFDIVSNWEYYPEAPKGGFAQGVDDASEGYRQHGQCGAAPDDPILFSVDYDVPVSASYKGHSPPWWIKAIRWIIIVVNHLRRYGISLFGGTPNEYLKVADYFRGIISVAGSVSLVGAYAEYDVIRRLFNDGLISMGWQTYAWSWGAWEPRAQLRQVQNGITVGGASCDRNEAHAEYFGQWGGRPAPIPRGDGAVLLNCPFDPDRQDMFYVGPNNEVWHRWWSGGIESMWTSPGASENLGGRMVVGTLTAVWTPNGEAIYIAGLGWPNSLDASTSQYWAFRLDKYGNRSGWGSIEECVGAMP